MIETTGFLIEDGTIGLKLDVDLLESDAGLTLNRVDDVTELSGNLTIDTPRTKSKIDVEINTGSLYSDGISLDIPEDVFDLVSGDVTVGFDITEESDFLFTGENGFTLLDGEIENTGTIGFETGAGDVTVGDFTIDFADDRVTETTRGIYIQNNVDGLIPAGTILFDVGNPIGEGLNIDEEAEVITDTADMFVSPELASILQEQGITTKDLTGVDVGDVSLEGFFETIEI